ncbi:hypothetical protein ABT237_11785 [Streptomyces sp. NPDC001581]|uniref:hypothetical protein n=1 Tax=Streptomyces sp. NPDC001581 TaxID=3154386 RepID=UPI00332587D2
MGKVAVEDAVPAVGVHPAGYGVLVTNSFTYPGLPGKPAQTSRRALRLIRENGSWVVDQVEDVDSLEDEPNAATLIRTVLAEG